MVLVTEATGSIGYFAVLDLLKRNEAVRAATTDSVKAAEFFGGTQASIVKLDYNDRVTLDAALRGVSKVIFICPPDMLSAARARPVMDALRVNGVRHVVYISAVGADKLPFLGQYHIEKLIRQADLRYTFIRSDMIMQDFGDLFHEDVCNGKISLPLGKAGAAFIDSRDLAASAVICLIESEWHYGRAYQLTGPELLTGTQVAGIFSDVLGCDITFESPSALSYRRALMERGVSAREATSSMCSCLIAKYLKPSRVTNGVPRLNKRESIALRQFVNEHKSCWMAKEPVLV